MRCSSVFGAVFIMTAFGTVLVAQTSIPHLRKSGTAIQLIVENKPFLVRGGELGNSTASSRESMAQVWEKLVRLNLNTVLIPIYWELIEPSEGKFDFSLVDNLILDARKHDLKIVPLWFGSWKNSMSSYAPDWVKTNQTRFPRSVGRDGRGMEILSPFSEANLKADADAFRALMRHLREFDSTENTVIMVQVENEIGMIPDSRDRSEIANKLYVGQVPYDLMTHLERNRQSLAEPLGRAWSSNGNKTRGTWEQVFGPGIATEELFTAWHFAKFTEIVTKAGKAEYPLPMFVNAALIRPGHVPGQYPSGGPLPHLVDVWRAGAPSVDFLSPDIYFQNFAEWSRKYDIPGNAFFIPEAGTFPSVAVNMLYAVGNHDAIGVSPFAIESVEDPIASQLASAYDLLKQLEPMILANQGRNAMAGLLSEGAEQRQPQRLVLNDAVLYVTYDKAVDPTARPLLSGGLVIATAPREFYVAGTGMTITFESSTPGPSTLGLLSVDEGGFSNGQWKTYRRLNGDQTHQGRHLRINAGKFEIQRVRLYQYN